MDTLDLTNERFKRLIESVREAENKRLAKTETKNVQSGFVDLSSSLSNVSTNSSESSSSSPNPFSFLDGLAGMNAGNNNSQESNFNSNVNSGEDKIIARLGNRIQELDEQISRLTERILRLESGLSGRYS